MISLIDELKPLVLNVGLAVHNGDWNWKNVNSPFTRLYYVTEGNAAIQLPARVQTLRPNHLYFIPAFTPHGYVCDSHFCHYYLHLYEEHAVETTFLDRWDFPVELPADELDLALFHRLCTINPHMKLSQSDPKGYDNDPTLMQSLQKNYRRDFCDKIESRGIVLQLLSRFFKCAQERCDSKDIRIEKTIGYIRKHVCETISLETLAELACLSKDHFIRLFKRETGVTPLKYINGKKLEKAQLILLTNNMSVKNVAYTLAFDDYSYFNRLFKKETGLTPQEYRRQGLDKWNVK